LAHRGSLDALLQTGLLGAALVLEELSEVLAAKGAVVVVTEAATPVAGTLTPAQERSLMLTPAESLKHLPFLQRDALVDPALALATVQRATRLRAMEASVAWAGRQARINVVRTLAVATGAARRAEAGEVAAAAAFLLGDGAAFISGIELVVDGGAGAVAKVAELEDAAHRWAARPGLS
jgi:hypothetical protein